MKKFFSGLALLTAVIALASCEDDLFDGGKKLKVGENEVVVAVKGNSTGMGTRSDAMRTVVAPSNVIDLPRKEGEMAVSLVETITSLDNNYADAVMGTRGTPVYTENFGDFYPKFMGVPFATTGGTDAYTEDDILYGAAREFYHDSELTIKKKGDDTPTFFYRFCFKDNEHWPEGENMYWFFEAIDGDGVGERTYYQDGHIEFDYTSPVDATDQKDILFTSKEMTEAMHQADNNYILFYHVLTGVKFKLSSETQFEGTNPIHVVINSVTINDMKNSGHCTVAPNYVSGTNTSTGDPSNKEGAKVNDKDSKSYACSLWKDLSGEQDYTLTFAQKNMQNTTVDGKDATKAFPESFYYDNSADDNLNNTDFSQTFLFIPQTLTDANTLTVNYTIYFGDGDDAMPQTFEKTITFPADDREWKAGELRTFALSVSRVLVAIDDVMYQADGTTKATGNNDAVVKKDLTTYNTGTAVEYQRVFVSANWVYTDEAGNSTIVRPFDLENDKYSTFRPNTEYWIKGADGFYYYKYPIKPGETPDVPLFDEFTMPEKAYFADTHLEMDISVQAIQCDLTEGGTKTSYFDAYWDTPQAADKSGSISGKIKDNQPEVPGEHKRTAK